MKNKSIIAKLLAEEDIFVVYKKMETAYFNPKSRELGLPIWNNELMTPDIEDLMVCHEIAHAIWTPLDMIEAARFRNIDHSFVNIIEDARIERMVQERYRGSVAVFNRGYRDLTKNDFFGLNDRDVSELNLIDRINLFFKKQKVEFSDEEKVWVKKVSECKTPNDVLDLSEELYAWMKENTPEEKSNDNSSDDSTENSDENLDMNSDTSSSESSEEGEEELSSSNSGNADDNSADIEQGENSENGNTTDSKTENGGSNPSSPAPFGNDDDSKCEPIATTDTDSNKSIEKLVDKDATDRVYASIPIISCDDVIIKYNDILDVSEKELSPHKTNEFYLKTKEAVVNMKADSKKTVSYMVKEFEMKKSADQYARAAVSKSGSLDMNRLHTYKYSDDIFKKVTTLPEGTNHGMVMVVDWSGSMYHNLNGTLTQLFNLIWFCRRTQIPFEVYAFTNGRAAVDFNIPDDLKGSGHLNPFKSGDLMLGSMRLLNFFSSKMKVDEEMDMMHNLFMSANSYYSREYYGRCDFNQPEIYSLHSTPLNESIIAMMEVVPKFKRETGVQKVNTIFLTDGASNALHYVYDYRFNEKENTHEESYERLRTYPDQKEIILLDPKTQKSYNVGYHNLTNLTDTLLDILKKRVDGMNLIGFFIAGSGKSGRVDKRVLGDILNKSAWDCMEEVKFINKNKYLAVTTSGYDEYYILNAAGLKVQNGGLSDDLVGASKAKLKSAFGKSMKSKIESRQLLNKFVKLVA